MLGKELENQLRDDHYKFLNEKILRFIRELNGLSITDSQHILKCVEGYIYEISRVDCKDINFQEVEDAILDR